LGAHIDITSLIANPYGSLEFNTDLFENEPYGFYTARSYSFVMQACIDDGAGGKNCQNIEYDITFNICFDEQLSLVDTNPFTLTRYIPSPGTSPSTVEWTNPSWFSSSDSYCPPRTFSVETSQGNPVTGDLDAVIDETVAYTDANGIGQTKMTFINDRIITNGAFNLKGETAVGSSALKPFVLNVECDSNSQTITRNNDNVLEFTISKTAAPGPNGGDIASLITVSDLTNEFTLGRSDFCPLNDF
jgi:hypothetical protein